MKIPNSKYCKRYESRKKVETNEIDISIRSCHISRIQYIRNQYIRRKTALRLETRHDGQVEGEED